MFSSRVSRPSTLPALPSAFICPSPVPGVMPPVRRARRARPAVTDGWLSRRRRRRTMNAGSKRHAGAEAGSDDDGALTPATLVPDDVLFGIFARASGAADVARCAATCRRWGGLVAARAAAICRALPAPPPPTAFIPHLALGVLFPQRKSAREAAQLRFVPTAFASTSRRPHIAGLSAGGTPLDDLDFDHARPVASRNGRVVLELRCAGGLTLCVWNPATGAVSVLPPLSGKDYPGGGDYACAILTSEDVADGPLSSSPGFFRVLVVYERRLSGSFTVLRCYSSDTGSWGAEAKKPGDKISGRVLRQLGPAVVVRGVAYWPMHHAALGVRLDGTSPAMDVCSVPYTLTRCELDEHVLGVSPDGRRLRFVGTGFVARRTLVICFLTSQLQGVVGCNSIDQSDDDDGGDDDIKILVPQIQVTRTTAVKLRWFGEKSGTLILTVGETGSSTSDVFAFNLATRSVEKLADGVCDHACRNLYGYEMVGQHSLRP